MFERMCRERVYSSCQGLQETLSSPPNPSSQPPPPPLHTICVSRGFGMQGVKCEVMEKAGKCPKFLG